MEFSQRWLPEEAPMCGEPSAAAKELSESIQCGMPWLTLPSSAEVPRADGALPADVRQDLRLAILSCERSLAMTATSAVRRTESLEPGAIGPEEIRNGWRKFFLGHHAFIYAFALLADFYRQQAAVREGVERPSPEVGTICALWRLAGALMAYGVDFPATEAIYRLSIRPSMPEAFSGTWLREYVSLAAQRRRFDRALDAGAEFHPAAARKVRDLLAEAEKCYHNLHFQVMLTCVPDLVSKLQDYQATHGKLTFEERHFARFDE